MGPSNNQTNGVGDFTLPPVDPAQAAGSAATPAPATPDPNAQVPAGQPPVAPQGAPVSPQPAAPTGTNIPVTDTPQIADDTDLIEKEWVEKAKQLVDQTKNDPYKQNQELNKFKAGYIKKRYNKDIKLQQ